MCGRFTLTTPTDEISEYFRILEGGAGFARHRHRPRYNIAPTQEVACVRRRVSPEEQGAATRELVEMRWGLIPSWAKDPGIGSRMINARSETVAEKPAYREAFRRRRCLVVADGFYEWKRMKGTKQPYFIYLENRQPFAFAGLWESWRPRHGHLDDLVGAGRPTVPLTSSGRVESCSFLTTGPNELVKDIHDRMPVILPPERWDAWLDPEFDDVEELAGFLLPYAAGHMRAHPVSTHVNKPANDDPACTAPLSKLKIVRPRADSPTDAEEPTQEDLF